MAGKPAGKPSMIPVRPRDEVACDVGEGGDVGGGGVGEGIGEVNGGWNGSWVTILLVKSLSARYGEGVRDLVGLASDVPDVTGELADEEGVTLGPQGPGGGRVSLCDGAGQGFVVGVLTASCPR